MNLPYDGRIPEPPYECPECVTLCAQLAEAQEENARLKRRLECSECVHCGETLDPEQLDHWQTCSEHPALARIAALEAALAEKEKI